jgi:hypothetical protein
MKNLIYVDYWMSQRTSKHPVLVQKEAEMEQETGTNIECFLNFIHTFWNCRIFYLNILVSKQNNRFPS